MSANTPNPFCSGEVGRDPARTSHESLGASEGGSAAVRHQLEAKLIEIGGHRVLYKEPDPYAVRLLSRGHLFTEPAKLKRGERSDCHANAAALWGRHIEGCHLVTGYGLSEDGIWRQHSWVSDGKRLYETTVKRERYFGLALSPQEALRFWGRCFLLDRYSGPLSLIEGLAEYFAKRFSENADEPPSAAPGPAGPVPAPATDGEGGNP